MEKNFYIGSYMKNFRQQRHISLRAASPDSASTLSRFENNKTQISGDRLRAVMQREGLRYWDLQRHSIEFLSPFKQLIDNLYIERFDFSNDRVTAVLQLYRNRTASADGNLIGVVNGVLDALELGLDHSIEVTLPNPTQQAIQEILFNTRDWIIFDYGLLWLAAPYLNTDILKKLFRRAIVQNTNAPTAYMDYFERVLNRVSVVLLRRHDSETGALVKPVLKSDRINAFAGEDALTYNFLQIVLSDEGINDKQRQLSQFENKLQVLQLTKMSNYFTTLTTNIFGAVGGDDDNGNNA